MEFKYVFYKNHQAKLLEIGPKLEALEREHSDFLRESDAELMSIQGDLEKSTLKFRHDNATAREVSGIDDPIQPGYKWNSIQKLVAGLLGSTKLMHIAYKEWFKTNVKVTQLLRNSTEDVTFFTMSPGDFDQIAKEFSRRGFTTPDGLELASE